MSTTSFIHSIFFLFVILQLHLYFLESKTIIHVDPDDDTMWTDFSSDLKEVIQSNLVVDTIEARPYDPVSEVPIEDQK